MALVDQRANVGERGPGVLAARVAPFLDRLKNGLRPVAAECPVYVDDDERRPFAEPAAHAIAGRREHRLVAFGEKFVPDRLRHALLLYCCPILGAADGGVTASHLRRS